MRFAEPLFLTLFLGIFAAFFWKRKRFFMPTILFPDVSALKQLENTRTRWLAKGVETIRIIALVLIVITLAQPQLIDENKRQSESGIDILLVLDVSGSMNAEDFKPKNRFHVAQQTIKNFINSRKSDRIGLAVFGGVAFSQVPLTLDYRILNQAIDRLKVGQAGDGTAVGMAVATGINRLKQSDAKSKVIILLTDGENNRGNIDPIKSAEMAKTMGIKIYSIGVGKEGGARIPIYHPNFGKRYARAIDGSYVLTKLDELTLKEMAVITGGDYFRARNEKELSEVYTTIDALEQSEIETLHYENIIDLFPTLLMICLILILIERFIAHVILVTVP
jgi:Ca-activated chloride channel homolog